MSYILAFFAQTILSSHESRPILSLFTILPVCRVVTINHMGDYVLFQMSIGKISWTYNFWHNNIHVRRLCYLGGSGWSWLPSTCYWTHWPYRLVKGERRPGSRSNVRFGPIIYADARENHQRTRLFSWYPFHSPTATQDYRSWKATAKVLHW